jgi:ankyrin repeat protein
MARMYYERHSHIIDWSNSSGKTALHVASLKGKEDLARVRDYVPFGALGSSDSLPQMLCDLGAEIDLTDDEGNTPLH